MQAFFEIFFNFFKLFSGLKSCVFNGFRPRFRYTFPRVFFVLFFCFYPTKNIYSYCFCTKKGSFIAFLSRKKPKTSYFSQSTKTLPPINSRRIESFTIMLSSSIVLKNLKKFNNRAASAYSASSGFIFSNRGCAYFFNTQIS